MGIPGRRMAVKVDPPVVSAQPLVPQTSARGGQHMAAQHAVGAESDIHRVIEAYLSGLYEGDVGKLASAFHPCAHLHSAQEGVVVAEPRDAWLERVRSRRSPKEDGFARDDVVHDVTVCGGAEASVRLEVSVGKRRFEDLLTLLPTAEGWRIVTKTFREVSA
jgi:hypothetical protein